MRTTHDASIVGSLRLLCELEFLGSRALVPRLTAKPSLDARVRVASASSQLDMALITHRFKGIFYASS